MLNSRHAHASRLLKNDVNWSKDGGQFLMKCELRLVKHEMATRLACKLLYGGIVTVSCCCYINCVLEHVVEGTVVRNCNFTSRSIVSCQQLMKNNLYNIFYYANYTSCINLSLLLSFSFKIDALFSLWTLWFIAFYRRSWYTCKSQLYSHTDRVYSRDYVQVHSFRINYDVSFVFCVNKEVLFWNMTSLQKHT